VAKAKKEETIFISQLKLTAIDKIFKIDYENKCGESIRTIHTKTLINPHFFPSVSIYPHLIFINIIFV
jgi:hypothetical protein